ncbi:MAG: PD-(D/E)XK nuclease family protein, partial [Acidimicrobiales bacterium]
AHLVASLATAPPPSPEQVAGQLLDWLFGLVATGQPVGTDLVADALGAGAAAGERDLARDWDSLSVEAQGEARMIVAACWPALVAWPQLPASALVRLQEPIVAELAGGRVVLAGRADLVLGQPGGGRAGSRLIDIKSGRRRQEDVVEAGWYAVLETLRHLAAPFQVGTYYLRDGTLALEVVTAEVLEQASGRIAEGIRRLVALAGGTEAAANPNPLCPWCPKIDSCEPGRRLASERGTYVPRLSWEAADEL